MNDHRDLRDLIDRALVERGARSGRALAELAQRNGHDVSHATINLIRSGSYRSRPSDETVRAIAWLARVDDQVAFRAAGLRVPGPPFAEELPPGVDNLSPEARKAVIGILRVLVQNEEVVGDASQRAAAPTIDASHIRPLDGSEGEADNALALTAAAHAYLDESLTDERIRRFPDPAALLTNIVSTESMYVRLRGAELLLSDMLDTLRVKGESITESTVEAGLRDALGEAHDEPRKTSDDERLTHTALERVYANQLARRWASRELPAPLLAIAPQDAAELILEIGARADVPFDWISDAADELTRDAEDDDLDEAVADAGVPSSEPGAADGNGPRRGPKVVPRPEHHVVRSRGTRPAKSN